MRWGAARSVGPRLTPARTLHRLSTSTHTDMSGLHGDGPVMADRERVFEEIARNLLDEFRSLAERVCPRRRRTEHQCRRLGRDLRLTGREDGWLLEWLRFRGISALRRAREAGTLPTRKRRVPASGPRRAGEVTSTGTPARTAGHRCSTPAPRTIRWPDPGDHRTEVLHAEYQCDGRRARSGCRSGRIEAWRRP